MNTNLNNIPIEIYCDYCFEQTNEEWIFEYLFVASLYGGTQIKILGDGIGYISACGQFYGYMCGFGLSNGGGYENIHHKGNGYQKNTGYGLNYGFGR